MKLKTHTGSTRAAAALGMASLMMFAFGSPQAAAKRAPEVPGKRAAKSAALRSVDQKQEAPGAAFYATWAQFRGKADRSAKAGASAFGDSSLFARFSALTGAPRVVYGDMGEAPAAAKGDDRAMLFLQANAHVFGLDTESLSLARRFERPGHPAHFYYNQTFQGLPVFYFLY